MKYFKCKVIKLDDVIEEAGIFKIDNYLLYCFVSYCSFELIEGYSYQVEIDYEIFDYPKAKLSKKDCGFYRQGSDFSYEMVAFLRDDSSLFINKELFFEQCNDISFEYPHLLGKKISVIIDRIDIDFIKPISI